MSSVVTSNSSSVQMGSFVRSRLGSFLAVAPLALWVTHHLWSNLAAYESEEAWQEQVTGYPHRIAHLVTSIVVLVPLAIHTAWGLSRMVKAKFNTAKYSYFSNRKYLLQRLSALGVLGFLLAHLYKASIEPRVLEGHPEEFSHIAAYMHHHTMTTVTYLLGTLAVAYHLSNGISTFAMGFGVISSRASLRKVNYLAYVMFAILLAMSWGAIFALYKAGADFPDPEWHPQTRDHID